MASCHRGSPCPQKNQYQEDSRVLPAEDARRLVSPHALILIPHHDTQSYNEDQGRYCKYDKHCFSLDYLQSLMEHKSKWNARQGSLLFLACYVLQGRQTAAIWLAEHAVLAQNCAIWDKHVRLRRTLDERKTALTDRRGAFQSHFFRLNRMSITAAVRIHTAQKRGYPHCQPISGKYLKFIP